MKNLFFLFLSFYFIPTIQSQEFSYGLILGVNGYDIGNNSGGGFDTGHGMDWLVPNIGVYGEYGFNRMLGIKAELTYNKKTLNREIPNYVYGDFVLNCIEFSPSFKLEFGKVYRKGFYMLAGPKVIFITSIDAEANQDTSGFKSSYTAAGMGMGVRILKIAEFEASYYFGLSPFSNYGNSTLSGFYVSLNFDIERIINGTNAALPATDIQD